MIIVEKIILQLLITLTVLLFFSCSGDSNGAKVEGCTDAAACNFNIDAKADDGSCIYPDDEGTEFENFCTCQGDTLDCTGLVCSDNSSVGNDDCGVCRNLDDDGWNSSCSGCMDSSAINYDSLATINANCVYTEKSSKRGLAFNLTDPADFEAIQNGVSWWYNWYFETGAPENFHSDYMMDFIPMLWGGNTSDDIVAVKNFILSHPEIEYLLVLNEPNLTDQANRTPSQAADDWVTYEQVIQDLADQGRTVYLVGPAMNWGTMPDYSDPVVWLDAFYDAYRSANNGNDPQIDYLAFHWYDYGLEDQLNRLEQYEKDIWVTEMANWNANINSYEDQIAQMEQMVSICENRDDVFRYAWFYGRVIPDNHFTSLFGPNPGELTILGETYLDLPYTDP